MTENLLNLETIEPTLDRELIKDMAEAQANSRQSLISLILIIGGVLTFFAALIRIYLRTNNQTELAAQSGLWHVVIYFLLGLLLLGRMRLSLLRAGWVWERIPMTGSVGGRWITYTLLMLVAAVIVAIVLPTQYSLGLLGTLGYLLSGLIQIVQAIIYFIAFLIIAFLSLFFPNIEAGKPLTNTLPKPTTPLVTPGTPPPSLSEFVQSLIFWAVFFVIAGYVLVQYPAPSPGDCRSLETHPRHDVAGAPVAAITNVVRWIVTAARGFARSAEKSAGIQRQPDRLPRPAAGSIRANCRRASRCSSTT